MQRVSRRNLAAAYGSVLAVAVSLLLSPASIVFATTIGTNISTNTLTAVGLKVTSGASNNFILTSDASGNATWISVGTALGNSTTDSLPEGSTNKYYDPSDVDSRADDRIDLQKGAAGGLAELDGSGKVPTGQLPALAFTDVFAVADIPTRDALTSIVTGDVVVVTDAGAGESRSYIWDGAAWLELKVPLQLSLIATNNLSDIVNVSTARTNISLGTGDSPMFAGLSLTAPLSISNGGTGATTATTAFNALSPLTTKGDLVTHDTTNNLRLGVGTNGQVLTADSAETSGLKWVNPTSGFTDPMTTRGDIIVRDATNTTARLGVGTSGQVLQSDGTDLAWSSLTSSSVGLGNVSNALQLVAANNLSDVVSATTSRGNLSAAKSGANSDITSLSALSTPLSYGQGGTGFASYADGDLLYGSASSGLLKLVASSSTRVLHSGSGAPSWSAVSLTADVSGTLGVDHGGTGATSLTSKGIVFGNGTSAVGVTAAGSAGQVLQSNGVSSPSYSTPTYPSASGTAGKILRADGTNNVYSTSTFADTYSASTLLYANGANTVEGLATANNGVLITSGLGVPSISSTIPSATQDNITRLGTVTSGVWTGTAIAAANGGTGQTSYTIGDLLYASSSSALSKLAAGADGLVLASNGAGTAPSWQTATTQVTGAGATSATAATLGTQVTDTATCAAGKLILGGGGQVTTTETGGNLKRAVLVSSYPSSTTVWTAIGMVADSNLGAGKTLTVTAYALCSP